MTDAIHNFHPQYQQYTQYSSGMSAVVVHWWLFFLSMLLNVHLHDDICRSIYYFASQFVYIVIYCLYRACGGIAEWNWAIKLTLYGCMEKMKVREVIWD